MKGRLKKMLELTLLAAMWSALGFYFVIAIASTPY